MLDSGVARDSEKCRPDMYQAIQWARTAWDEVTADTIKNCWNKVMIMPSPVVLQVVGPGMLYLTSCATYWIQLARNVMSWPS